MDKSGAHLVRFRPSGRCAGGLKSVNCLNLLHIVIVIEHSGHVDVGVQKG